MEVYNKDKPKGKPLIASKLVTPKQIKVQTNGNTSITVKNKKGNTGSFISAIKIIGTGKDNYKIESKTEHFLVDANSTFNIEVKHLEKLSNKKATLEIVYNGDIVKTIALITE
ncbi:hypothetical protein JCM19274_2295 [Algibacter lectus]|nr:hypothetical protein [Algibacter lectus]GAL82576.1 hypothetical protein JCM19274_2295 [Algibacter lectus]